MARSTIKRLTPAFALIALTIALSPAYSEAAHSEKPLATTGAVTHVRGLSAELQGTVLPRSQTTSYYFQYGPTSALGSQTTPGTLPPGTTRVKVGQTVTGFLAGYHYRLIATSAAGTSMGHERVYTLKTVKGAFTVVKPTAPGVFGGPATISGVLSGTGNANRLLALQASPYPYLTAFAPFGTTTLTNAVGAFVFHIPSLTASTQYRVATLDPRPLYSPVVSEQVAARVTLHVRTSARKGLVRLYGTVTPAEPGAHILFQLRKPVRPSGKSEQTTRFATQFTTIVKRATRTASRFSAIVEVRRGGRYRAYVELKKGALVSGASSTVVLAAAPSAKKH